MEKDGAVGGVRDRPQRDHEVRRVRAEDARVRDPPVARWVVDLHVVTDVVAEVGIELAEQRDMNDVDVDVAWRVLAELLRPAEVDDARDAVCLERAPPVVGQLPDVVGTNEAPEQRLAAVLERDTAEVPDVQAPLPFQMTRQAAAVSAPRYASITAASCCTSSGVPSAILRPKSRTWMRSAIPITRPM